MWASLFVITVGKGRNGAGQGRTERETVTRENNIQPNKKKKKKKSQKKEKEKRISLYFLTSKYRTKERLRRCVPLFEIPDVVVVRKKETKNIVTHTHIGE